MTSNSQRDAIDEIAVAEDRTVGEVTRELVGLGLAFRGTEAAADVLGEP